MVPGGQGCFYPARWVGETASTQLWTQVDAPIATWNLPAESTVDAGACLGLLPPCCGRGWQGLGWDRGMGWFQGGEGRGSRRKPKLIACPSGHNKIAHPRFIPIDSTGILSITATQPSFCQQRKQTQEEKPRRETFGIPRPRDLGEMFNWRNASFFFSHVFATLIRKKGLLEDDTWHWEVPLLFIQYDFSD